jgi:hypothetical protein
MLDVAGDDLVVIANTADDVQIYESHVSPDPDLVMFWLADRIDARGWGLAGDTFHVMEGLRELGEDVWFNLGDRDLALCLRRARRLGEGARLTEALAEAAAALGVRARVLPMADQPVRTRIFARGRWVAFQEFMIREQAQGPVDGVEFEGIQAATPPAEAPSSTCRAWPRRCARARRRSSRSRRSSAARSSRARRSRSWPGPGCRSTPRASPPPTGACSAAWSRTSRSTGCPPCARTR